MRFAVLAIAAAVSVSGQSLVNANRLPRNLSFEAVPGEKALRCEVTPLKPALNFGFRFQTGYSARIPLMEFTGKGNRLIAFTRITPKGTDTRPFHLAQVIPLPEIPAGAPRKDSIIEIGGNYLLGEGEYKVDWLMVDNLGRFCHKHWTDNAVLKGSNRHIKPAMAPNLVTDLTLRGTKLPSPDDEDMRKLRLTVMLHATPMSFRRTTLRANDEAMLLGTLSALMGRIPTLSVRLVVFNLEQHQEIFRREHFQLKDLEEVSDAMQSVQLGKVDFSVLKDKGGHLNLLAKLVNDELLPDAPKSELDTRPSDVVIFLGPQARNFDKLASQTIERTGGGIPRFFYFRFEPLFRRTPNSGLPDIISHAVRSLKGKNISIHTPAEFSKAIDQVLSKANQDAVGH